MGTHIKPSFSEVRNILHVSIWLCYDVFIWCKYFCWPDVLIYCGSQDAQLLFSFLLLKPSPHSGLLGVFHIQESFWIQIMQIISVNKSHIALNWISLIWKGLEHCDNYSQHKVLLSINQRFHDITDQSFCSHYSFIICRRSPAPHAYCRSWLY